MKIRVGYELIYDFPKSTPVIMVLGTHFTRASDVIVPDPRRAITWRERWQCISLKPSALVSDKVWGIMHLTSSA